MFRCYQPSCHVKLINQVLSAENCFVSVLFSTPNSHCSRPLDSASPIFLSLLHFQLSYGFYISEVGQHVSSNQAQTPLTEHINYFTCLCYRRLHVDDAHIMHRHLSAHISNCCLPPMLMTPMLLTPHDVHPLAVHPLCCSPLMLELSL